MRYQPTHYIGDARHRYLLGTLGRRNLLFLAVNPSLADDQHSDTTITKIIRFAARNGYDGWFVANIYPQRSTDPKGIHHQPDPKLVRENIWHLSQFIKENKIEAVVACWGNLILSRPYFKANLRALVRQTELGSLPWFCLGLTKTGLPRHPSRVAYCRFQPFKLVESGHDLASLR